MNAALRRNPESAALQFHGGNLYRALGQHTAARTAYARAIERGGSGGDAYLGLAGSYQDTGEWERAESVYQELLARQPKNALAYEQLGLLLYRDLKRPAEARQYLSEYLRLRPDAPDRAQIERMLGK